MSDTPETDKNSVEWDRANMRGCSHEFAQSLERERDKLRAEKAELVEALESINREASKGNDSICTDSIFLWSKDALQKAKEAK